MVEASGTVGGRLASRTLEARQGMARFDAGAQFFTVRSERFRRLVQQWQEAGVVRQWSEGFATADGSYYRDGYPRFRGEPDMQAIAQHLAKGLELQLGTRIVRIEYEAGWRAVDDGGHVYEAPYLILTPPVPLALELLQNGGTSLPPHTHELLSRIHYDPCWAVLAVLDGPSRIPQPGGMWPGGDLISWMADNVQKGISQVPSVTIHGSPEFSRNHFDSAPEEAARMLLQEAQPWLGATVVRYEVQRWEHSIPVQLHNEPVLFCEQPGPLAFAGDAFAGPRVEGAALSGLAAAEVWEL